MNKENEMQPTRLTVEGELRDPEIEEEETNVIVDAFEQVTISLAGNEASIAQGWGWAPFECVKDGTELPTAEDPCPDCGEINARPTPLYWASSASIVADSESDMVTLRLNLLSGGFLQMEVHRAQDGQRLILHTPKAGTVAHGVATITQVADGAYEIKE